MLRNIFIPMAILIFGVLGMIIMINSASSEERQTPEPTVLTVDAISVELNKEPLSFKVQGG